MTFADSIASGIKKSVDFKGSAGRAEYWYFALFVFLVQIVLGVADTALSLATGTNFNWFANLASIALFLPQLSLSARRFHDAGFSAKWLLVQVIPLVAFFFALPSLIKFSQFTEIPSDAQVLTIFGSVAPFMVSLLIVGIFTLTITLFPSKPYVAGNKYVQPSESDPKLDELKQQGW